MNRRIILVVAMAENGVIGAGGQLPWRLPTDMKRFRRLTWGKPIIMGRKTFEAIGKPLEGRDNIVISRQSDFAPEGVLVAKSFDEALVLGEHFAAARGGNAIAVIGGGRVYRAALPIADRIEMTIVHANIEGDTTFPNLDMKQWRDVSREKCERGENDSHDTSFVVFERVRAPVSG
jgi:dihydrofolate reductase